ncbi:MAG TPA: 30S ribosomal protein S17 [Syntrophorhabdaceae bacterium]|mgnify:CR=1 FL=1|nr:30S ribosomal protein S17 [Syntrophorhabdaceae bacterium]
MERVVHKRKMIGVVLKDKMDKTVVVEVEKFHKHPKYHKYIRIKKRYKAHDEDNRCSIGDKVLIVESRPISKEKKWLVKDIISREESVTIQEEVAKDDTREN